MNIRVYIILCCWLLSNYIDKFLNSLTFIIVVIRNKMHILKNKNLKILRGVAQLVKPWIAPQKSQVQVSQTSGPLEAYIVVNFRALED